MRLFNYIKSKPMNFRKHISSSLLGKENNHMKTVAIVGGVAVGIVIGALFATKKGRKIKDQILSAADDLITTLFNREEKTVANELGNLVSNVRDHVKKSAEGLLGDENTRKNPSEIKVEGTGTTAWKSPTPKPDFPGTKAMPN